MLPLQRLAVVVTWMRMAPTLLLPGGRAALALLKAAVASLTLPACSEHWMLVEGCKSIRCR